MSDNIIITVERGTRLPDDLLLVHERADRYAIQPSVQMSVESEQLHFSSFQRLDLT
ncbi:hypothetical protein F4804DRAFT_329536 [Jackrogersella minutella]|nr:hypothetical protein F4804DRAFT_329536 [Jackrogersella minutella]